MANPCSSHTLPTSLEHTESGVSIISTTSSVSSVSSSVGDDLFPCSFPSAPIPSASTTELTATFPSTSSSAACPPSTQLTQGLSLDSELEITDEFALAMSFNDSSNESDSDLDGFHSAHSTPQSTPQPPQIDDDDKVGEDNNDLDIDDEDEDDDINEHVHVVHRSHRTLIIFDWDDTLHPTSLLKKRQTLSLTEVRAFGLRLYQTLLDLIRLYGASNIFIVSNADRVWIEQCLLSLAGTYWVNVYHLISLFDIQIISAKNRFSALYPNEATAWKEKTIEYLVRKHQRRAVLSAGAEEGPLAVVCIGDSQHEHIASGRVVARLNAGKHGAERMVLHRVKLLERPTLKQLTSQYELIAMFAPLFGEQTDAIDIDYEREMRHFATQ